MRIRALIAVAALALASAALGQDPPPAPLAQEPLPATPRGELGIRYWLSTGETRHSHNAQGADPSLGNPTSVLTYENLDANILELHGRQGFLENWFVKGNLGLGIVNTGAFDDEDFLAGQRKFLDTTSSVTEGRLRYFTLDIGRDEWTLRGERTTLGVFVGFNQWTEDVDAYGITTTVDPFRIGGNAGNSLLVISNKARWQSLRIGLAANIDFTDRTRLTADLAFIPYARLYNEDSHHLRTDPSDPDSFLGPVPNIIHEGRGAGVQLDAELQHQIFPRTEIGVGLRFWYLEATQGERKVPALSGVPDLPLVEFYSMRFGLTFSLRRSW